MIRSVLLCLAVSVALGAAACSPGATADKDAVEATGKAGMKVDLAERVSSNTYRNTAFGITVTAPDGWYVPDNEMTRKIMEAGADIVTADQKGAAKAAMDASVARTVSIFSFLKHEPGSPQSDDAGIAAVAEDVSIVPSVTRGRDYFFHAKNALKATSVVFEETAPYSTRKIGGQDFDRMDLKLTVMGNTAMQRYFAAKRGKHMILFIQSYTNEADLPVLDKVLDSIKLDW
jgi:hypothetical protein